MLSNIVGDNCLEQVANVAFCRASRNIRWRCRTFIGVRLSHRRVLRDRPNEGGVISPGGVGYDINCGVRLMRTHLKREDVAPKIHELVAQLFRDIPCGLGRGSD